MNDKLVDQSPTTLSVQTQNFNVVAKKVVVIFFISQHGYTKRYFSINFNVLSSETSFVDGST